MGTRVINFYDNFKCLASECPNTCCRGWKISIDDNTVNNYKKESGKEGLRLFLTMTFGKNKEVRKFFGRCANETKDGLCRLELKGRKDLMPEVCRIYPRRSIQIGDDKEVTFELSCPMTARLFLDNLDDLYLKEYQGENIDPVWIQDMFNEKYYKDILNVRDKVIDYINKDISLPKVLSDLYRYFRRLYNHVLSQDIDIKTIPIIDNNDEEMDYSYSFYSMSLIDKVIMNDLSDGRFRSQDALYDFSKKYNRIFGQMTAGEADYYFDKKCKKMIVEYPELQKKYKAYLIYYMYQTLYSSYESVTFYKEYLLGVVYLSILMLTDVVDYINGMDLEDKERQVNNLNNCEKRLRHNVSIKKRISHRLDEEFTKENEGYKF